MREMLRSLKIFTVGFQGTLHQGPIAPMMRPLLLFALILFFAQPKAYTLIPGGLTVLARCGRVLGKTMRSKRTILCVDDNEQALSIRKLMLETRGYRVLACTSGHQALEIFRQGGIDLVLADLLMPGLDGVGLVGQIKDASPETPAILFSGKVKTYEKDTRADVFLPKGMYAPVELLERIRQLLVKKRGPKRAGTVPAQRMPAAG
jgi:CheY-like chemotaxis protein